MQQFRGRVRPRHIKLLRFNGLDHHELAHRSLVHELDSPGDLREKRVILAPTDIESRFHTRAALPHDNGSAGHKLPAERFEAQSLRVRIATVS